MNKLIDEIQKLDYVNIPLFKKMIININDNIKRSLEKSNFNKASKLKYFKILLIKYIKEVKYINDDRYLKNILDKMKNLSVKIGEITNSEENDVLIDVHFPKFDDEYMNLLLIFIYKFSKINHKSLALLGTDYLKKLYYTIQNSSLDNTYSKVSLYDFIINNPNKKLDKFIKFIKENNYKEKLISYSIKLLHPLYLRNVIVNIKHIKNLKLFKNKSSNQKTKEAQEEIDGHLGYYAPLQYQEAELFLTDDDFVFYKSILKSFINNYPRFNKDNYKEYIREFIEKILDYNVNNIDYIMNCNMRFKYSMTEKKIIMLIDISEEDKTYVYDNLIKLLDKINNYDLNDKLSKYDVKLNNRTIIYIKMIILILIIDIFKNERRSLVENKVDTFINYVKKTNKKETLVNNIRYVLEHIKQTLSTPEVFLVNNINDNGYSHFQKIKFILKKTERNFYDLDPYGNLFNNKISYFNECKKILKDFITKVPHLYSSSKQDNYVLDLQNYIDELINSETNTLRKKIAVIETKDVENILKLNFSKDQNYVYDILLNNFFSNNDVMEYDLNNSEEKDEENKTINIYIYKSRHYIVNVLIIFLTFIFKNNKLDICDNLELLLYNFKDKLMTILNLDKYYSGCENIKKNIKLETFCLNKYNLIYKDKLNLIEISTYLVDIIENNKFKITYDKKNDRFDFTVDYSTKIKKITEHLTNSQFLIAINEDINSFMKKNINKIIITFLTKFMSEVTSIFTNIFTNSKFIINLLNIQINDSHKKNIFQYLNDSDKDSNEYYKLNFNVRKLCIIIFIKVFLRYILVQFKNGISVEKIFTDIIEIIRDIICNKIYIEYRYNHKEIFNDFIKKYSFISTK